MSSDVTLLRRSIIEMCLRLEDEGYVVGTYGNVSVRVPGGLLITPSRVGYRGLTPEDIVEVGLDGAVGPGQRLPSSETSVHRLIFNARPDIGAVLHTHALHATMVSCLRSSVPVIVEEQAQALGGVIPCARYIPAGSHEALGHEVARALGGSQAVLLANHGLVACGSDLAEALFSTRITERVCQMYLMTVAAGGAVPIDERSVRSERDRWLRRYGTSEDREVEG